MLAPPPPYENDVMYGAAFTNPQYLERFSQVVMAHRDRSGAKGLQLSLGNAAGSGPGQLATRDTASDLVWPSGDAG